MIILPIANILINFIAVVWLLSALLLIFIILIQKGKGGGLGGAFGGAGGGGGLLGTKTGDFLTWVTIGLVFMFFFLAIILVKFGKLSADESLKGPGNNTNTKLPAGDGEKTPDTKVDTTPDTETTPDAGKTGDTDSDTDSDAHTDGDGDTDGEGHTDGDADGDADKDADTME